MSIELANYLFLAVASPFAIWSAWSDLKYMKIRNVTVLLLTGAFIISGVILLPLDVFMWRILGGVIVLICRRMGIEAEYCFIPDESPKNAGKKRKRKPKANDADGAQN